MAEERALNPARLAALALGSWMAACGAAAPPPSPRNAALPETPSPPRPPNVVIILADDLGYGDLSSYGAPRIRTPNLDRLAAEGMRFMEFYVTSPLCTPSRGSLLTGRYPPRTGLVGNLPAEPSVPDIPTGPGSGGISDREITLGEALRRLGYRTGIVGKWHLGSLKQYLPTHHGFDSYFGLPAGDDVRFIVRGDQPVSDPVGLDDLTLAYTREAVAFIHAWHDRRFFLYLAHRSPHVPLAVSGFFRGRSAGGLYGDVVEELDFGVGEVVRALQEENIERETLVFFTSDNGPWLGEHANGGSAGPLYGGKGSPFEGGIREPAIAWWPGRIPAGRVVSQPLSTLDLFPTAVGLAGGQLSADRRYDGMDISSILFGGEEPLTGSGVGGGREILTYIASNAVALRSGAWKHVEGNGYWSAAPLLFDVETDLGERQDQSLAQPDLQRQLTSRLKQLHAEVATGAPQPQK